MGGSVFFFKKNAQLRNLIFFQYFDPSFWQKGIKVVQLWGFSNTNSQTSRKSQSLKKLPWCFSFPSPAVFFRIFPRTNQPTELQASLIEGLQPKGDTPQKLDAGTIEFQDVSLGVAFFFGDA